MQIFLSGLKKLCISPLKASNSFLLGHYISYRKHLTFISFTFYTVNTLFYQVCTFGPIKSRGINKYLVKHDPG